jgi:FkbM family methyltransferase
MHAQQPASLHDAVGRIWSRITGSSSTIASVFERIIESFYTKLVRPGDTVIDGGAHHGRHTIPLARLVGDDGLVMAFEPLPAAADKLTQLLGAAAVQNRVRLSPEALARSRGQQRFFVVNNMLEYSGLRSRSYVNFVPDQTAIQVEVTTIDAAFTAMAPRGPLSFVKLDLESGEFRALQGAEQTLRTHQPCCTFENGLQSSADGYDASEFFGFFDSLDYELFDILGSPVTERCWATPGPWDFVAVPRTRRDLLPLLWASALEELLASPWLVDQPLAPPPSSFRSVAGPPAGVVGHIDHVEASIRITGWAGDLLTGQPVRALAVVIDGTPLGLHRPDGPRHDVAAATGRPGFDRAGFDVTVKAAGGQQVELLAEGADGSFGRLAAPIQYQGPNRMA